jgi:pyrroloquinoline-quinone synthase
LDFWDRLEVVQDRNDVLRHPFYVRWSAGELTMDELALYAGQYRFAVAALADATAGAARAAYVATPGAAATYAAKPDAAAAPALAAELAAHAKEESDHIALWEGFARAVGADPDAKPLPKTADCATTWAGDGRPLLESLVALYAIESAQPAIAETKRVGLANHYGVTDPQATAYFDIHVERDVEHAAQGRALIEERLPAEDQESLLARAEAVLAANWRLLDGVEAA